MWELLRFRASYLVFATSWKCFTSSILRPPTTHRITVRKIHQKRLISIFRQSNICQILYEVSRQKWLKMRLLKLFSNTVRYVRGRPRPKLHTETKVYILSQNHHKTTKHSNKKCKQTAENVNKQLKISTNSWKCKQIAETLVSTNRVLPQCVLLVIEADN